MYKYLIIMYYLWFNFSKALEYLNIQYIYLWAIMCTCHSLFLSNIKKKYLNVEVQIFKIMHVINAKIQCQPVQ